VTIPIRQIHGIICAIGIPIGPHALLSNLPPIRLDEPADVGVVVSGIEEEEAGGGIIAFTDEAVLFGDALGLQHGGVWIAKRGVGSGLLCKTGGAGDQAGRGQMIAVALALHSRNLHLPHSNQFS